MSAATTAADDRSGHLRRRPGLSFIAWSSVEGRSQDIASALGGEARCFFSFGSPHRALVPVRYGVNSIRTVMYLAKRRPRAVIASNPPVIPGLIAMLYGALWKAPVMLDSHPSAFGQKDSLAGRAFLPVHRWMVSRVAGSLVPSEDLAAIVRSWGGNASVFHEAPPRWRVRAGAANGGRTRVLLVGILATDEPVAEAVEAAGRLSDVDLFVTGDVRKLPRSIIDRAPENVHFTGFLRGEAFRRAIEEADFILTLTTNETAAMRAAYEAVYAGRPLIISDSPERRDLFPHAIHVTNDAASIEQGLRLAVENRAQLVALTTDASRLQYERLEAQLATLKSTLGGEYAA
jgi:glycosyltransferase involved in cell wall biosynthesis